MKPFSFSWWVWMMLAPLALAGFAIVAGLIVLLSPVWLCCAALAGVRNRRLHRKHAGEVLLIWRSRRGWHDFVVNNVLPALPGEMQGLRAVRGGPPLAEWLLRRGSFGSNPERATPLLAFVDRRDVYLRSIHRDLLPLKRLARRDPAVQQRVREIVWSAIRTPRASLRH